MAIRDEESYNLEVFIPLFKLRGYLLEISFDNKKSFCNLERFLDLEYFFTQEKIIQDAKDKLKELNRKKQELSPNMANHQLDVLEKQLKV